ncbi:MAG: dihydropteroate synthase-like protein [Methanoregulaceae archaeon]
MQILLPTGSITASILRSAAKGLNADVVITGEVASFVTPDAVRDLLRMKEYDMVIVSGMCTASFDKVEEETRIPVYRGTRHAADMAFLLPLIGTIELSRTIPADDFLILKKREGALRHIREMEENASFDYLIRGVKIGGTSRMKVLSEIMDAHKEKHLREKVLAALSSGSDIVDLGFGFDATPEDVSRCFTQLEDISSPLSVDTQDPDLILAALGRADLVLSLHEGNISSIGNDVAQSGSAAVVVPRGKTLEENLAAAEDAGISCLIADPLLQPVGSGLVQSLCRFRNYGYPLFFGAGNVVELLDADSPGVNALLAAMAHETGASVIFTSEHSDKTQGSISEMRTATEMMVLTRDRPYPKDLGIDLLILKEKRRRREPACVCQEEVHAGPVPKEIIYDPRGNFRIGIDAGEIIVVHRNLAIRGKHWDEVLETLLARDLVSRLDHAAYLGKELYKAELAIRYGRSFEQDGPF